MRLFSNIEESKAKTRAKLGEADIDPTEGQFANAPILDRWQVAMNPFGLTVLLGQVTGHPTLNGPFICTSPLLRLNGPAGWARSFSRIYRLGTALINAPPMTKEAFLAAAAMKGYREIPSESVPEAIERNRNYILDHPSIFGAANVARKS